MMKNEYLMWLRQAWIRYRMLLFNRAFCAAHTYLLYMMKSATKHLSLSELLWASGALTTYGRVPEDVLGMD